MQTINVTYQLTLTDYRQATYYGLFLRHRRPLAIMFIVLGAATIYGIAALSGMGAPNPLVFFLAAAYLIWGLLLFAGAERGIRRYIKQPDNLLGCSYRCIAESHRVRFEVEERGIRVSCAINELACAFELHSLFLLYTSPRDVYLLPKRVLNEQQTTELRTALSSLLTERFSSRFLPRKKKKLVLFR